MKLNWIFQRGGVLEKNPSHGELRMFSGITHCSNTLASNFLQNFICSFLELFLQKGYRSLHTAARKDFAKAAKLLLQKDQKPDIEAPVSPSTFLIFLNLIL